MARVNPIQTNFTGGQVSPRLYARTDITWYENGAELLSNMIVHPHGGASKRSGTAFVADGYDNGASHDNEIPSRLIPFVFSTGDVYALEYLPYVNTTHSGFAGGVLRFFRNHGTVLDGGSALEVSLPGANTTYDVSTGVYSGRLLDVSGEADGPNLSFTWNNDGSKLYVLDNSTPRVFEYDISDVYNVSTASYSGRSLGVAEQASSPVGLVWNNDGSKLYILDKGLDNVYEYDVSTVYDVSTAVYSGQFLYVGGQDAIPEGLAWNGDGSKLYIAGSFTSDIYEYDVTTVYDLSTASYSGRSLDVGGEADVPAGIAWDNDGSNLYVLDVNTNAIYSYNVGTAYDVSTASYSGRFLDVRDQSSNATDLAWNGGGTKLYIIDSDTNIIYEYDVSAAWTEAIIDRMQVTQSADVLYHVLGSLAPYKLQRQSATNWTFTEVDFRDGPYLDVNTTATTLQADAATGSVTVTASSTTGINGGKGFLATDVGRLVRIADSGTWAWGTITAVNSTTEVDVTIESDETFPTTGTTDWRLGAWSDTTGWPKSVTFHQQRLVFANTTTQPNTVWMSRTADFENFSPTDPDGTVADDHAITYSLAAGVIDEVRWLRSIRALGIGTAGSEFSMTGETTRSAITTAAVTAARETGLGAAEVPPVIVDNAVVFVTRTGRKLVSWTYNFQLDGYQAPELTLYSEAIPYPAIKDITYQSEPDRTIWAVRTDGKLIGLTYLPEQDVLAWHEHDVAGTDAEVESITVTPTPDQRADELWMVVKRTVDGRVRRHIEYLEQPFGPGDEIEDAFFVDSGLTYDGAETDTFSGLDHLEGEEVAILGDGAPQTRKTVSGGSVTIDEPASKVAIGLPYTGKIRSLDYSPNGRLGTSKGQTKAIYKVNVQFYRTVGASVGPDASNLEPVLFRSSADPMSSAVEPFSGIKEVKFHGRYDEQARVYIENGQPLPMTVLALMPQMVVNE